jgi:hypothetical protein
MWAAARCSPNADWHCTQQRLPTTHLLLLQRTQTETRLS